MVQQTPKKKVFVGMSGGVDSSVSAALLHQAGYDVTGVFIKVWEPEWITCTSSADRLDALRVAGVLGIPFITIDLEKEYKKEVVDYMVREYTEGRTPNPDVMCNQHVKFGAFYAWAMNQGADYIATGHYARIVGGQLAKGNDSAKDQSYFLWTLKKEQLNHVLFPVGEIEKPEVRNLARKFGLPTAEKKDSQGLCFIGKVDLKEFLSHFVSTKKGNVLDEKGRAIGEHDGATFLTLGQRHGFRVDHESPDEKPYFIVAKNVVANTITVSHNHPTKGDDLRGQEEIHLKDVNWSAGLPKQDYRYFARARYRQELVACTLSHREGRWVAQREKPLGATAGQSLVVYDGEISIGGGIIV